MPNDTLLKYIAMASGNTNLLGVPVDQMKPSATAKFSADPSPHVERYDPAKPQTKKIPVVESKSIGYMKLPEFLSFIEDAISQIPQEFRDEAIVDMDAYSDYDTISSNFSLYYYRPETTEEIYCRIRDAENAAQRKEIEEKLQFELLRAKYGA